MPLALRPWPLLVALLALPVSAGGNATALAVEATGPQVLSAPLVAFATTVDSVDGPAVTALELTAARMVVREEFQDTDPAIATLGVSESTSRVRAFADVSGATVHMDPRSYVFVAARTGHAPPALAMATTASTIAATAETTLVQESFVPGGRQEATVALAKSVHARPAAADLVVTGDFLLFVHGHDIDLAAADGPATVRTGEEADTYAGPVAGIRTLEHRRDAQAYLFAEDATLRLRLDEPTRASLFVGAGRLELDGQLRLTDTRGVLGGDKRLDGDVTWTGRVGLSYAPDGQRVRTDVAGAPASAGGVPVAAAGPWWLLLVPALVAAWYVQARLHLRTTVRCMERREYARVARRRIAGVGAMRREGHVMRAVACVRLGRTDDAERALRRLPTRGPSGAMRHFIHAHVAAARGQETEARAYVARTVAILPDMEAEVMANPLLARLWKATEGYT